MDPVSSRAGFLFRLLDISLSFIGILLAAPLMILLFLLGLKDTGSPVFVQVRVGRDQVPFNLYKFRTMRPGAPSVATHLMSVQDVTAYGRFLRKYKLDELPQLFNVLFGQMSLVGPRPCLPNQNELIALRSQADVFAVRPGITGAAQINNIDMSDPARLVSVEKLMLAAMSPRQYIRLLVATVLGRGTGDHLGESH